MGDDVKITPISSASFLLGEGPHWNEEDQSLLFVDIMQGNIHRYFLQTQRMQNLHLEDIGKGSTVSFIIPVENAADNFIVSQGVSLSLLKWSPTEPDNQDKKPNLLHALDESLVEKVQFNDAKCDHNGKLIVGTMDKGFLEKQDQFLGSLFSFDSDFKLSRFITNIALSNGLAWSGDNKTFYYIDTLTFRVDAFDYSLETGTLSNRRCVFDYKSHPEVKGMADGMCIDEDDNLWVACFGGFQVLNIDPRTGKLIRILEMPARNITSCCWGGPDYSTLFVTSSTLQCEKDFEAYPHTGKTFAVTGLGVKGRPPNKYRVNDLSKISKL